MSHGRVPHKVDVERTANGVPIVNAATLAVIGDIKHMSTKYVRGRYLIGMELHFCGNWRANTDSR